MAVELYDTMTLIGVQNRQQIDPLFFLQFFPDEITFTTEKVAFDEISEDRYILAPFVAPHVEGEELDRAPLHAAIAEVDRQGAEVEVDQHRLVPAACLARAPLVRAVEGEAQTP